MPQGSHLQIINQLINLSMNKFLFLILKTNIMDPLMFHNH